MGDVVDQLRDAGLGRGDLVGLAVAGDRATMAVADRDAHLVIALGDVRQVEEELRPRWATWSQDTRRLVEAGLRVAAAWDVAAVHRLLFGEWRAEPARAWARLQDLPLDTLPTTQPFDLFSHADWTALDPMTRSAPTAT